MLHNIAASFLLEEIKIKIKIKTQGPHKKNISDFLYYTGLLLVYEFNAK